jgi:exopolysaccharide biosynthesis protein
VFVFPPTLAPPPPFPLVLTTAVQSAFVAPGVRRATYRLTTSSGSLVISVVSVDVSDPTVRLGAALAADRLISPGETVSSMASRTGAVAGVNADYFDIGQTNQPLGIVVRGGALVRTPSKRIALEVTRDRTVRFASFRFSGTVAYGATQIPLTGVDEWPPQGGATVLEPAYGAVKPMAGVLLATLTPLGDASVLDGDYRIDAIGEVRNALPPPQGLMLGLGPAALRLAPPPALGATVTISSALDPPLGGLATAVGGGPLLVQNGVAYEDPNAPAPEERNRRFPVSGAATTPGGALLLIAVDGRQPAESIGLTRPEFGALMLGLGASDGMAFDSGGSATLVARILGDDRASLLNTPSDGVERPVADGLFVYSDAPIGVDPHLVVRPETFEALPGAPIALRAAIVDDAGHRLRNADVAPLRAASDAGPHTVAIAERAGGLSATVSYRTVARLTRLEIESQTPIATPGGTLRVYARGYDRDEEPVYLGPVDWSASEGAITTDGVYRAPAHDATVTARAGGMTASLVVHVGSHAQPLNIFSAPTSWQFATYPAGAAGAVSFPSNGAQMELAYDLSGPARAAYANGSFLLPGTPLGFSLDVRGDGSDVGLRAAFINRYGERRALTLAKAVDWTGWRRLEITLPPDLNPPVRLVSIYAVGSLGGAPLRVAGSIGFRNPAVTIAGTP